MSLFFRCRVFIIGTLFPTLSICLNINPSPFCTRNINPIRISKVHANLDSFSSFQRRNEEKYSKAVHRESCTRTRSFLKMTAEQPQEAAEKMSSRSNDEIEIDAFKSLASSQVISIIRKHDDPNNAFEEIWTLSPFVTDKNRDLSDGSIALQALEKNTIFPRGNNEWSYRIRCVSIRHSDLSLPPKCDVTIETSDNDVESDETDEELLRLLAKIVIQRCITQLFHCYAAGAPDSKNKRHSTVEASVSFLQNTKENFVLPSSPACQTDRSLIDALFPSMQSEMVEMVSSKGTPLGILPRPLVHRFNILHRGVGIMICDGIDRDISSFFSTFEPTASIPKIYVHRRTATKLIFPSLYSMSVGGVSGAFEDPRTTAAREVEEELGLSKKGSLSDPLFECTICTSYNRCVVTCFAYCYDQDLETINWQEEEVAWGALLSYSTVQKAARLSVDRLKARGEWPGKETVQSFSGEMNEDSKQNNDDWAVWDFVPDGLLVWEAWEVWRQACSRLQK